MFSVQSLCVLFCILLVFAVVAFVSIVAGNVLLGLATVLWLGMMLFNLYKKHKTCSAWSWADIGVVLWPQGVDYGYILAFAVWSGSWLLSNLLGYGIGLSMKVWADFFLWRVMPFFIVMTLPLSKQQVKMLLLAVFVGMTIVDGHIIYKWFMTGQRVGSWNGTPMTAAGEMCIVLPAMLITFCDNAIFQKWSKYVGLLFVLGMFALVFNNTRGAWIAVAAAVCVVLGCHFSDCKKSIAVVCVGLLCVGGMFLMKPQLLNRWTVDPNSYSTVTRVRMWTAAYNMWKDYPIFGVGLGQYSRLYKTQYMLKMAGEEERRFDHAHNNVIQAMAENGVVGLFGYLFFWGYVLMRSWQDWKIQRNPYALMIFTSTLALLIQGLTEHNIGNSVVMKLYWMMLGTCLLLQRERDFFRNKNVEV